MTFTTILY